ncbi:MAG: hypothetical protein KA195_00235 [Burkholderiaceae bacterium]|nr:hypothetical protein [Burkholderiaceae bacterium]
MATNTQDSKQLPEQGATPGGEIAPKRKTDWEAIERDFRVGILSVREIASAHSVSHTAINKRAKAENWVRDLKAKIQAKAEAEVSKRAVSTEVSKERQATERQVVEANAEAIVHVRLSHRQDIKRGRSIVMRLLDELELQTGPENAALLEELGVLLRKEDDKGVDKLNDLYQKVISLPGRAKTMKDLGETLRVLIGLERQAFGLDDAPEGEGGDKSFLEAMLNARARAANR